jgi:hypothetical protein
LVSHHYYSRPNSRVRPNSRINYCLDFFIHFPSLRI